MKTRAERPDENRPKIPLPRAEPIYEPTGKKIAQRIYNGKDSSNRAVIIIGPSKHRSYKVLISKRKDLTIKVIYRCCKEKQRTDNPTEVC